jgi:hypothetical protein
MKNKGHDTLIDNTLVKDDPVFIQINQQIEE